MTQPSDTPADELVYRLNDEWICVVRSTGWILAKISISSDGVKNGAHDGTEHGKKAWAMLCERIDTGAKS